LAPKCSWCQSCDDAGRAQALLPDTQVSAYIACMDGLTLPPELERFADEAIAAGRYRDRAELLAASVSLLRQAEAEVAAFVQSLEEAQAEAERMGCRSADDVHREMAAMIDEMAHARA
jgi:putative addiction module CopG family antidote